MEAYLAQSPLFHKSMAISADLKRVFLVSSAFRAEPSNTSRHLTEFTMLSGEMEIMKHYSEDGLTFFCINLVLRSSLVNHLLVCR